VKLNNKILPGALCEIKLGNLIITADGFATVGGQLTNKMLVYEKIDLFSYPSSNDFRGKSSSVKDGDIVIILKYIGRPEKVIKDPVWFQYDIYEVLLPCGHKRQMFKQNLFKVQR
jgi:hypothetical protein|tara:strand:+ start:610 stop:954 length:345 start_codon:yes stop_codon:yes gene_type:complete